MNSDKHSLLIHEVATVSVLSGIMLGFLCICLCNTITCLCGVELVYSPISIGFRCGVAIIISLAGIIPLYAVARKRNDLFSYLLGGPQLALFGTLTFFACGMIRWGDPPEFMWPIYAGFILYGFILQVIISIVAYYKNKKLAFTGSISTTTSPQA